MKDGRLQSRISAAAINHSDGQGGWRKNFDVTLSKGLRLTETLDGGLAALEGSDERLVFSPPNVQDASGLAAGYSTAATALRLVDSDTVRLTLDPTWLSAPERQFSVRLDPSYDRAPASRTHLNSGTPTTNLSGNTELRLGTDTSGSRNNVLAKFDLAVIPRDAEVYRADLSVDTLMSDPGADGITVQAKPLTRAWTTGATWNTYNGTNAWTTAGGDAGAVAASSRYSEIDGLRFDARTLVTNWGVCCRFG